MPQGGTMGLINDFKAFLLRDNVVDPAVAVVIGTAFGTVVTTLVEDLGTPLIAAIGGQPDFSALDFTINDSTFLYGDFINKMITFVTIAGVIFFFVVTPMNALLIRARKEPPADPTTKRCPECVSEIPIEAKRCAFCTTVLAGA
jgi:large conductance mechanosensitive channel